MNKKAQDALLNNTLLTPEKFNNIIEHTRYKFPSYLDTISDYCVNHNLELKFVKKLLNLQILGKLTAECNSLNLIAKTSHTTPLF